MPLILVTGASGFIGQALCKRMKEHDWRVRGTFRPLAGRKSLPANIEAAEIPAIGRHTDWLAPLNGVDVVVHLAAYVHTMKETVLDPLAAYREVNSLGTERLARTAAACGVKRFIYLSSVKVMGPGSSMPYTEADTSAPSDPYGVSKWEAEQILREIGTSSNLEVVILRSPLVYGPGVKANFLSLLKAVSRGIPLPLAGIKNRRSFIYIGNLVDAIILSMKHENAPGGIFMVGDGRDISTPDLIRIIGSAMGKNPFLFPVPLYMLRFFGLLTGKQSEIERLTSSLFIDCSKISSTLGWLPPFSMEEGIRHTVEWFRLREENP